MDTHFEFLDSFPIRAYKIHNMLPSTFGEMEATQPVCFYPQQCVATPMDHFAAPLYGVPESVVKVNNVCPNRSRAEQESAPVVTYARCGQCCLQRLVIIEDVGVYVENVPENVEVEQLDRGGYWRCRH